MNKNPQYDTNGETYPLVPGRSVTFKNIKDAIFKRHPAQTAENYLIT